MIPNCVDALPSHFKMLEKLKKQLVKEKYLGLMILTIQNLDIIEQENGPEIYKKTLEKLCSFFKKQRGSLTPKQAVLCFSDIGYPSFLFFFSQSLNKDAHLNRQQIKEWSKKLRLKCTTDFTKILHPYVKSTPKIITASSLSIYSELIDPQRTILRMVEEVKHMTRSSLPIVKIKNKERIQNIIINQNIRTVFHPIMDFQKNSPMGFEALSRGPKGTDLESPYALFSLAKEVGLEFELDRLCRTKAIEASKTIPDTYKIFINIMPLTVYDPDFKGKKLKALLKKNGKKPDQFIFEVNERNAIENYTTFSKATQYYTDLGFSFAVDDTGTGYSALEAIIEMKPKYLKCDISMIKGIHNSAVKQEMLKMLCLLARKIDAVIIAEGIEKKQDFELLKKMGLHLGQGFLFSVPKERKILFKK